MTKSSQNPEGGAYQRLLLRIPRCGHKRLRENATLLNLKILSQPLFRSLEQEKERYYEDRKVLLTQIYMPQLGHRIHWSDHDNAVILTKIRGAFAKASRIYRIIHHPHLLLAAHLADHYVRVEIVKAWALVCAARTALKPARLVYQCYSSDEH